MQTSKKSLGSQFVAVVTPFFRSECRRRALFKLSLLIVLLLGTNGLNVINSFVTQHFFTALEQRQFERFYALAGALAVVFAGATIVEVFTRYTEQRLGILWRDWLTRRLLDRYLANRTYRRLALGSDIDNPDQRLSEDVRTFTASTLSFLILFLNAGLTLVAFAGILWAITPWLFVTAAAYAACGSLGTVLLGYKLVGLDNRQLQKEADFRFTLAQFREQSEAVAQVGGEEGEKVRIGTRLESVVDNFRSIIRVTRNLGFFTTGYNYLPQIIPVAVVAPLYIRGDVTFGTIPQAAMAFAQVLAAFSLIVSQFQQLSAYAAVVGRVGAMWEATEERALPPEELPARAPLPAPAESLLPSTPPPIEIVAGGHRIAYDCLTLRTPKGGRLLIRDLSLELPEGKRLLVTGPHGSGKTALILATAGLWEDVQGHITCPGPDRVMFLPQRPYLIPGRLGDLLVYGLDHGAVPEGRLREVLDDLGLGPVVRNAGGLDADRDWAEILSEGEQQALAFARLLLARPLFAFLDNAASSLDEEWQDRLYGALARTAITYVSVGNLAALAKHHDLRLELLGDGNWQVGTTGTSNGRVVGQPGAVQKNGAQEVTSNH